MLFNMVQKLSLATASAALLSFGVGEAAFAIGFEGAYDPTNWTLTNSNANGYVNTSNAPDSILEIGGNNGSGWGGQTLYTTTAAGSGLVSFDWNYSTSDWSSYYDPFGVVLNGSFTQLTNNNAGISQLGSYSFNVSQGDNFGFGIKTVDNAFGSGKVEISNFSAPVPEPITGLVLAAGMGGAALSRAKKAKKS